MPLSGFPCQMFAFLQESSGLFEQRFDQYFQIKEANLVWLINRGKRYPLDLKIGIVHSTWGVLSIIALVRILDPIFL